MVQIDDLVRDATADEVAQIDAQHDEAQAQADAVKAKAVAKASALAKLKLTADEAAALLG